MKSIKKQSPRKDNAFDKLAASLLLSALAFPVAASQRPNSVDGVDISVQGPETIVRFRMHDRLAQVPTNFKIDRQTKIVVDFDGAATSLKTVDRASVGQIEGATIAQGDGKTRAVFKLASQSSYSFRIEGKILVMTVRPVAQAPAEPEAVEQVAPIVVSNIDFKRGVNGESKIVVDLSDELSAVDVRRQGTSLIIDLPGASIPENLRKKFNVADFGTNVQSFTATSLRGKGRIALDPKGDWEYNAYQVDKQLFVEVSKRKEAQADADAKAYKGDKLTLNFQNSDVRAVLNVLADYTDLNLIASDTVQGSLTLRLKNVPWDQVLDVVLQAKNLDMRRNGNVILVAPRDEIAKREKEIMDNAAALSDNEPLKSESFQLNYTTGAEMLAVLTNDKQRILSKRGSAVLDARTNQIFVQDIPERLAQVGKMVKKIDIAMRQVQIEARIVEANDKFSSNLGARIGLNTAPFGVGGAKAAVGGGLPSSGYQTGQTTTVPDFLKDGLSVNLPATSTTGAAAGAFSMVLFNNSATRFLNLELSALEAAGNGKIISSPRVVTADQEVALIEQGVELPYQEASASGAATISFKKANLRLEVQPHITPDGNIIMSVEINKDAPGTATASGIAIDTKHIKAKVMIENGGTVVIGGIYTQDERSDVSKIPVLGDLPVAGALFRNKVKQDTKTELLFFLTPRILDSRISLVK
jgi:type IV pilus assembly protein PilQ